MAAIRQRLKFENIGDLDAGTLRVEFNKQLDALVQDLHDRPYVEKQRILVLKIGLKPVPDKQNADNSLGQIDLAWEVDNKSPKRGMARTTLAPINDGSLVFMSDMPDAADDNTILDEVERRRLEQAERARASKDASGDQAAVERQAIDGK